MAALPDLAAAFPEVLGGMVSGELKICKIAADEVYSSRLNKENFIYRSQMKIQSYPPKPYRVLPCLFRAYTTSMAVTVFLLACSV